MLNPYHPEGLWLKVNLHLHTNRSDGQWPPAEAVAAYRLDGYHAVAVTDHDRLFGPDDLPEPGLLLIPAQEVHLQEDHLEGCSYHILALGISREIPRQPSAQEAVDAVRAQGGLAVLCHPLWSDMRQEEMDAVTGCFAVEIWNGVCERTLNRGNSVFYWDSHLSRFDPRPLLPEGPPQPLWAVAVDDAHRYPEDVGKGWVWVQVPREHHPPTVEDVLEALRSGAFYSTQGPRLETILLEGDRLVVYTSSAVSVRFVGSGGRVRERVSGEHLKSAEYRITGEERYVRVEVEDRAGRRAWSNPIWVEDGSSR